jgi:hypothetical protein
MRIPILLVVVVVAGCTESDPTYCDDKIECKPGYWCNLDTKTCIKNDAGPDGMPDQGPSRDQGSPGDKGAPADGALDGAIDHGPVDAGPPDIKPGPDGPHCGDGKKNLAEECDKTDLAGESCATLGYAVGTLKCTAGCKFDKSGCRYWELLKPPTAEGLTGVWGSSKADMWMVGHKGTLLHFDGAKWFKILAPVANSITSIWGSSATDIWAGSDDGLLHYDGNNWVLMSAISVHHLHGQSASLVFGTDGAGKMFAFDGLSWSTVANLGGITYTVWVVGPNDVWTGGMSGGSAIAMHFDGAKWTNTMSGGMKAVADIWAASSNDVWAVGFFGEISRYDGKVWSSVLTLPPGGTFNSVHGESPTSVWAVGHEMHHFNGSKWSKVKSPVSFALQAVWGSTSTGMWAVGSGGTVLRLK